MTTRDPYNSPGLFTPVKSCCACGRSAPLRAKGAQEVPIIALSTVLYRYGNRPQLKAVQRVRICQPCLATIISTLGAPTSEGRALLRAMVEKIGPCLIELLSEDSAPIDTQSGPQEAQCSL